MPQKKPGQLESRVARCSDDGDPSPGRSSEHFLHPFLDGRARRARGRDNQNGVVSRQGAGHFFPMFRVDSGGERLRAAGRSLQHQHVLCRTNIEQEFLQRAAQRGGGAASSPQPLPLKVVGNLPPFSRASVRADRAIASPASRAFPSEPGGGASHPGSRRVRPRRASGSVLVGIVSVRPCMYNYAFLYIYVNNHTARKCHVKQQSQRDSRIFHSSSSQAEKFHVHPRRSKIESLPLPGARRRRKIPAVKIEEAFQWGVLEFF